MRNVKKKKLAQLVFALIGTVLVAAFPALFLFFKNADQAHFIEIIPVMFAFIGSGLCGFFITMLIVKKAAQAGLITCAFLVVFLNYTAIEDIIQRILPSLRFWHIIPILVVILIHIAWVLCKYAPNDICDLSMPVISVVICVLIVTNAIPAISVINARNQAEQETRQNTIAEVKADIEMPNVYYLLFDEYSSCDFIKKYYNYDNKAFTEKLIKQGFSISYSSHNDSVKTTTVVANLMNLEYVADDSWTEYEKTQARKNGQLFNILVEHGYSLYSLTDMYGLQMIDQTQTRKGATTVSGETLGDILVKNSVAYPLYIKQVNEVQKQIDSIIQYTNEQKKNRFLMAHFILPHQPFIYDRNGNMLSTSSTDWKDKHYYLDQYIYATKVMDELVCAILQNDPNSVIILQSDHSARAPSDPDIYKKIFTMEDMSNCFNCVYYPEKTLEIEGLSGVNTARLVFGTLLNLELPQIEVPYSTINGFAEGGMPK